MAIGKIVSLDYFDTHSIDEFSFGVKDVGAVTGLDIHRDHYNNADWAFDYVSNNNTYTTSSKQKQKSIYIWSPDVWNRFRQAFYYCCLCC